VDCGVQTNHNEDDILAPEVSETPEASPSITATALPFLTEVAHSANAEGRREYPRLAIPISNDRPRPSESIRVIQPITIGPLTKQPRLGRRNLPPPSDRVTRSKPRK
jgi:hypothetical protein